MQGDTVSHYVELIDENRNDRSFVFSLLVHFFLFFFRARKRFGTGACRHHYWWMVDKVRARDGQCKLAPDLEPSPFYTKPSRPCAKDDDGVWKNITFYEHASAVACMYRRLHRAFCVCNPQSAESILENRRVVRHLKGDRDRATAARSRIERTQIADENSFSRAVQLGNNFATLIYSSFNR